MKYKSKSPTLLKKSTAQGSQLPESQKKFVPAGKTYEVNKVLDIDGLHRHLEFLEGIGSWWVFLPHWEVATSNRTFVACKERVFNRGNAPDPFLNELVDWCISAPDLVFSRNENFDIYSQVSSDLGPWESLTHRKAVMLEVLRVLGGFESSWDWEAGVDTSNPNSNTPCTEEAGIFQCSGDSMNFDPSLKRLLREAAGETDCDTFRSTSKSDHKFAIEYCARLIRFTVNHHGPIKRKEINSWLRREAVNEFRSFLVDS